MGKTKRTPRHPRRSKPRRPLIPATRYLRHQLLTKRMGLLAVPILVAGLVLADTKGWLSADGHDLITYHDRRFRVIRVIDGDTLDIQSTNHPTGTTRVRLWGIDAPETAKTPQRQPAQPFSDEATRLARRLCEGKTVRLLLDPTRLRGRYGRLLAYVRLPDGTLLNEHLITTGLAVADRRFNHRQMQRFIILEQQARHDAVGIWSQPQNLWPSSDTSRLGPRLHAVHTRSSPSSITHHQGHHHRERGPTDP